MERQRWEESEKRREEERRSEKRKSQKKEDAGAGKGGKAAKHRIFPLICGSGGSKSRLAKAAGAEPSGEMRNEKVHAVVARSTFRSQNAPHLTFGALFEIEMWKKCTQLWREAHFLLLLLQQLLLLLLLLLLPLPPPPPLLYTTTNTTNTNRNAHILRYITVITLHYTNCI